MTAHDDRARDEQPAPAAREIPVDELAEAERYWHDIADRKVGSTNYWGLPLLLAEYDERGRERDAARTERDALSRLLRGMARRLWKHRMAFRQIRQGGAARERRLEQERDAARAEVEFLQADNEQMLAQHTADLDEVERLRAEQHEVQCPSCSATIRARLADQAERAELERLRAAYDELRARARRIADHDPRPEAAGAALRILGSGS